MEAVFVVLAAVDSREWLDITEGPFDPRAGVFRPRDPGDRSSVGGEARTMPVSGQQPLLSARGGNRVDALPVAHRGVHRYQTLNELDSLLHVDY